MHGNKDKRTEAKEWFNTNLLELEDIVRRALFLIIELLQTGTKLTGEDNLDKYLFEQVLTGNSSKLQKSVTNVGKLSMLHVLL